MAAQCALIELCQLIRIRNQSDASFDFDAIEEGDYLYADNSVKAHPYALANGDESDQDIKENILSIVVLLKTKGYETLALDYSRGHIPLNTAKVFVPGLCHIWPQLANERIYNVPVSLGWLEEANTEATINPQGLYI